MKVTETDTSISASEWAVMRIVWTMGNCSSNTITAQLEQSKGWKPSTVKTLLRRLVLKGLLSTQADGRRFIYQAKICQKQALQQAGHEFLDEVCQKQQGKLLADMIANTVISQSDLDNLAALIAEKKQAAPTSVACNCCTDMN